MKLFVHFDEEGRILSVARVHRTGDAPQNPYIHVERQEHVLEMDATEEFQALDAHEIAEQYKVDLKSKTLKKQKQAGPTKREQPRKGAEKKPRRKSD